MDTNKHKKPVPSFGGSFGHGWRTMMKYFLILLLVVIILSIIAAPFKMGNVNWNLDQFHWDKENLPFLIPGFAVIGVLAFILGVIVLAYILLVVPVFRYGSNLIFVHAARDIRPEFETLIRGFRENYLYIILANLLTIALVMLGIIFLVIPGIIVGCRLAFVSYLVMDKKLDPIIAVEESWKLTKGYGWTIFLMGIVSFFLCIIGLALLFVGILPAIIWVKSSFASLYEAVLIKKNAKTEIEEQ